MQVSIEHRNWRIDEEAVERPWAVTVNGVEVARTSTIGGAGDVARWIQPDWSKVQVNI